MLDHVSPGSQIILLARKMILVCFGPKARDLAGIANLAHTRLYSPRDNTRATNGRTLDLFGKSSASAR